MFRKTENHNSKFLLQFRVCEQQTLVELDWWGHPPDFMDRQLWKVILIYKVDDIHRITWVNIVVIIFSLMEIMFHRAYRQQVQEAVYRIVSNRPNVLMAIYMRKAQVTRKSVNHWVTMYRRRKWRGLSKRVYQSRLDWDLHRPCEKVVFLVHRVLFGDNCEAKILETKYNNFLKDSSYNTLHISFLTYLCLNLVHIRFICISF